MSRVNKSRPAKYSLFNKKLNIPARVGILMIHSVVLTRLKSWTWVFNYEQEVFDYEHRHHRLAYVTVRKSVR